jgi:hypothetical protein
MSSAIACVAAPVRAMSLAPAKASKAVTVKAPVMKKTSAFQVRVVDKCCVNAPL